MAGQVRPGALCRAPFRGRAHRSRVAPRMSAGKPRIAVVFGTRPEAIKMVPVIRALQAEPRIETVVISTGQHKQMLAQMLERFQVKVDHEMDLMEPNQSLYRLSSKAISAFEQVLKLSQPTMM